MEITRYRPLKAMRPSRHFLSHFFGNRPWDFFNEENLYATPRFYPSIDVAETDKDFKLKAELPGMDIGDIKVEVTDGLLTLKGERKREEKVEKEGYYREERHYGSFERSFRLPEHAEAEKITAELKKGVLDITIPKTEEAEPKKIEIHTE